MIILSISHYKSSNKINYSKFTKKYERVFEARTEGQETQIHVPTVVTVVVWQTRWFNNQGLKYAPSLSVYFLSLVYICLRTSQRISWFIRQLNLRTLRSFAKIILIVWKWESEYRHLPWITEEFILDIHRMKISILLHNSLSTNVFVSVIKSGLSN